MFFFNYIVFLFIFIIILFMKKNFDILYLVIALIFSYGIGLIFKDSYLLGSTTLYIAFIHTLLQAKGKWYQEFVGIASTILSTVVSLLAHMYSSAIFSVLVYIPLSIFSIMNWKKNKNKNDDIVKLNKMTFGKSLIVIVSIVLSSVVLSFLLSLIPSQRLAFLDAVSSVLNICGILLIALRFKEGWIVWILCNFIDISIWIISLVNGYSGNSVMMIIMSVVNVALNIWGFVSFIKLRNKQEINANENLQENMPTANLDNINN